MWGYKQDSKFCHHLFHHLPKANQTWFYASINTVHKSFISKYPPVSTTFPQMTLRVPRNKHIASLINSLKWVPDHYKNTMSLQSAMIHWLTPALSTSPTSAMRALNTCAIILTLIFLVYASKKLKHMVNVVSHFRIFQLKWTASELNIFQKNIWKYIFSPTTFAYTFMIFVCLEPGK